MISNSIISMIRSELKRHEHLESKYAKEYPKMPEGTLCRKKTRGTNRYYWRKSPKTPGTAPDFIYLSKDQHEIASLLVRKKFLADSLKRLRINIKYMKLFLKHYAPFDPTEISANLPPAYEGISWDINRDSIEKNHPAKWFFEKHPASELYPETLIYNTSCGFKVRSKSETIIAEMLDANSIPFRYESQLVLGGQEYYPDFTILNPRNNKIMYWEHFGMMDKEAYKQQTRDKLQTYEDYGILPWNNLILTYETESSPLDVEKISCIIKAFLTA